MMQNKILEQVIKWVEPQASIRAVILVGSHAEQKTTDELSDYDLSLFCTQTSSFIESDDWLEEIAKTWVSIPEKFTFQGKAIPTRLAIFEGGDKVDFAFYPENLLSDLQNAKPLPSEYDMGYKILVDKDGHAKGMRSPSFEGFKEERPTKEEFHSLVKEFWFEVYHVAKYLYREDLWSAQFRLNGIRQNDMIQMICWHEAAKHEWDYTVHKLGKNLHNWVSGDIWNALHDIFPHLDVFEGWIALKKTIQLFKKLSHEVSKALGYDNLSVLELQMNQFVEKLEKRRGR